MKKLIFTLLFLSTVSILADQPAVLSPRHLQGTGPISVDYLVYSQPYDLSFAGYGVMIYGEHGGWACDDFVLDNDYYIDEIYVYMMWTTEQASMMNLVISEDNIGDWDPNTNIDVWSETVPCTNTFTGDSNWGYDIYETYMNFYYSYPPYPPYLHPGTHYYFETQADVTDNCFILVSHNYIGDYCWFNDGSGIWVRSDVTFEQDSDMFFDFDGQFLDFESETWGNIKTLF